MRPVEVYFGFWAPTLRTDGRWSAAGIFGHVEAWFYTIDQNWVFLDPQGRGIRLVVTHLHDEVLDHLAARQELCLSILKLPYEAPAFRLPLHGPMTCASICGALVGIRALLPSTLRRRLLRKGAEIIHEAERGPGREGGQAAPAAAR